MFFDFGIGYGPDSLNLEPAKKHLRQHFQCIPFAFPKHLALPAVGEIFYVCKLVLPDGIEVFKIHAEGIVFYENPDVVAFA